MNAAMKMLQRDELMSLEQYARERAGFRARVLEHKRPRQLRLGEHLTLYFEDRLTIQYQIQEMLRIERIFEEHGIQEELAAYNPLIPSGSNWKATLMVEYADPEERVRALAELIGIENSVWMQVEGHGRLLPYADEDLDRTTEEKTSAVHFVRFELTPEMIASVKAGASISAGVDHAKYQVTVAPVPEATGRSLAADLE
jgi:hypothetical protein